MTDTAAQPGAKDDSERQDALAAIARAGSEDDLRQLRLDWLGRKGRLTARLKALGSLPPEQRARAGQACNRLKQELGEALAARAAELARAAPAAPVDALDIDLASRRQFAGSVHPINDCCERIVNFFLAKGFGVVNGPDVEDDDHNFRWLNFSPDHPARTMHDSFYLEGDLLLRTHTSSVQIRYMKGHQPPARIIAPGRVFRRDRDLTHSPMFTQVEGLVVDRAVSIGELLAILDGLMKQIFLAHSLKTRFRPSYFPFTEPSLEMDISCLKCGGAGCRVCGHSGWLEVLGCGMVHPAVLRNVGIDANAFSGYAFGLGVERIAMLAHGIDDLRLLFENHLGFLGQFQPS